MVVKVIRDAVCLEELFHGGDELLALLNEALNAAKGELGVGGQVALRGDEGRVVGDLEAIAEDVGEDLGVGGLVLGDVHGGGGRSDLGDRSQDGARGSVPDHGLKALSAMRERWVWI